MFRPPGKNKAAQAWPGLGPASGAPFSHFPTRICTAQKIMRSPPLSFEGPGLPGSGEVLLSMSYRELSAAAKTPVRKPHLPHHQDNPDLPPSTAQCYSFLWLSGETDGDLLRPWADGCLSFREKAEFAFPGSSKRPAHWNMMVFNLLLGKPLPHKG